MLAKVLAVDGALTNMLPAELPTPGSSIVLQFTKSEAVRIHEALDEAVTTSGFNEDYSLNEFGKALEPVLDKFLWL